MPIFRACKNAKIALQHPIIFGVLASPWTTLKTEKRKFAYSWEMKSVSGHLKSVLHVTHVLCWWSEQSLHPDICIAGTLTLKLVWVGEMIRWKSFQSVRSLPRTKIDLKGSSTKSPIWWRDGISDGIITTWSSKSDKRYTYITYLSQRMIGSAGRSATTEFVVFPQILYWIQHFGPGNSGLQVFRYTSKLFEQAFLY